MSANDVAGPKPSEWNERIYSIMESRGLQLDCVRNNIILRNGTRCVVVAVDNSPVHTSNMGCPVGIVRFRAIVGTGSTGSYEEVWKCADGRELRVMDMDEDHVRATLNMLLRNRRRRNELKRDLKALKVWEDEVESDDAKWGKS